MANRTGQGFSVPTLSRETGVSGDVPLVSLARSSGAAKNAGEASFALGSVLRDISTRFEDRLDLAAKIDGERQGAIEGAKDQPPVRADDATIRGRAFNASMRDAVGVRYDLKGREILSEYEQKNMASPQKFKAAAEAYIRGALPEIQAFDPALAQRFEAEFKVRMTDAHERILSRQRDIERDRQVEQALRHQLAVEDEMATDAAALFSGDAKNAQATLARMMSNAARVVDTANHIGADGRPLFSARERIAAEQNAEILVSESIGRAWLSRQPDMIGAFQSWRDGKAEISLQGEDGVIRTVNMKEMLGERGHAMALKSFAENLRSDLSMRSAINAEQDRAFRRNSDAVYTDMMTLAQGGDLPPGAAGPPARLSLQMVEAAKASLEPDKYLALRELARSGGAAVSNGAEYARLAVMDADGQDVRDEARLAYQSGQLSRPDFLKLYDSNSTRVERGAKPPIQTGRDYLTKGLGALSKEIGMAQSASIGGADAEYDIEISAFIDKNQRQPTHAEARDIAERVRSRYSVLSVEDSLVSLPLPRLMTQSERLSKTLSAATIGEKVQKTNEEFLKIHGGDAARRDADPEYLREMRLLKQYHDLLKTKEAQNAGSR